jgi:hypothetical protein
MCFALPDAEFWGEIMDKLHNGIPPKIVRQG